MHQSRFDHPWLPAYGKKRTRLAPERTLTHKAETFVRASNRNPFGPGSRQCVATIGSPFLNLTLLTFHAPPGAPLRNGSIFI